MEQFYSEQRRLCNEIQNLKNSKAHVFKHFFEVLHLLEEIQTLLGSKNNSGDGKHILFEFLILINPTFGNFTFLEQHLRCKCLI